MQTYVHMHMYKTIHAFTRIAYSYHFYIYVDIVLNDEKVLVLKILMLTLKNNFSPPYHSLKNIHVHLDMHGRKAYLKFVVVAAYMLWLLYAGALNHHVGVITFAPFQILFGGFYLVIFFSIAILLWQHLLHE